MTTNHQPLLRDEQGAAQHEAQGCARPRRGRARCHSPRDCGRRSRRGDLGRCPPGPAGGVGPPEGDRHHLQHELGQAGVRLLRPRAGRGRWRRLGVRARFAATTRTAVTLWQLQPSTRLNGFNRQGFAVGASETGGGVGGAWWVQAYALCANPISGHHISESPTRPPTSTAMKRADAFCDTAAARGCSAQVRASSTRPTRSACRSLGSTRWEASLVPRPTRMRPATPSPGD